MWQRSLPSATKLLRLCFYMCLSVHGGVSAPGGVCSGGRGVPLPGDLLLGGVCSWGCLLLGELVSQHALRQTPRPPVEMATVADGTHPTGMHSCHWHGLVCRKQGEVVTYRYNFSSGLRFQVEAYKSQNFLSKSIAYQWQSLQIVVILTRSTI